MTPVFIYTLNDPVTGIVRYCGQTVDPDRRLRDHIRYARKEKWHTAYWVKKLLSKNLRPVMEILDVVPDIEADFWEREYIQNFRERGFDLTNMTPGGDGCGCGETHPLFGKPVPPERGAKISAALTGKVTPPEVRTKQSAAATGRKQSPEAKANQIAAQTGKKRSPGACAALQTSHTPERRAKTSAFQRANPNSGMFKPGQVSWNKGRKFSPEHCTNLSAALKGRKLSPETCAKMSTSQKIRRKKEEKNYGAN